MRKRLQKGLSLALALMLVVALAAPAGAATPLKLTVNGQETAADLILKDSTSLIEVSSLAAVTGTKVDAGAAQTVEIDGKTYVPLRAAAESLGFKVKWAPGLVELEQALKDGMTAMDVLVKSNQACQGINTYSMSGFIKQTMVMEAEGESMPMETMSELHGQVQNNPIRIYMKQTVSVPSGIAGEAGDGLSMEVETYIDEEYMYMNSPDQGGWVKMPNFLPVEVLKEQQDLTNDPLKAAQQMLEMGYAPSFGEDAVVDGRECYTINASIDMAKAMESQMELLQQVLGNVGQTVAAELGAETDAAAQEAFAKAFELILAKMLEEGVFDYRVTMFIDKETFLPAQMNLVMSMKFDFDVAEFLGLIAEAIGEEVPAEIMAEFQTALKMDSYQEGEIRLFGFGAEFVEPDLSNVIDAAGLINEAVPVPAE